MKTWILTENQRHQHHDRPLNRPGMLCPARSKAVTPGVRAAVMLRTEPARRLCPDPFRASGFPS
ncbi:hypothetical protein D1629_24335 (plasmid) [Pantoea agglomerans]|nr:hypothetical protein D1629_24335 [Pantoea agglomerans]QAV52370.1 hypothetical protein D1628_24145 [Pantoea agglomerans]